MKKRVLYAVANYAEIVRDNGYFVDKTRYIAELESVKNPVFLRPRRFGKSLLCTTLEYYYDRRYAERFEELFGHTWIGRHPTGWQNRFMVLSLDFSTVATEGSTLAEIGNSFTVQCNARLSVLKHRYCPDDTPEIDKTALVADNLETLLGYIQEYGLPRLYVIIDEYDNFANQLITSRRDALYRELTADGSFLKSFFKTLKQGRKSGAIVQVFITGVLPMAMDDLASGFNVASFISLHPKFESMLGFSQSELDRLLDEIYRDHDLDPATRTEVGSLMKNHYNGYHFVRPDGEALYNPTLVLYFLNWFYDVKTLPEQLTDMNLKTHVAWVRRLTATNERTEEFVDQLMLHNSILYDKDALTEQFDMTRFFDKSFFPVSFFYLGMLTRKDAFHLQLPNLNMRQIFTQYFNDIHRIDVSTRYTDFMAAFVENPDLEMLFGGYWREYVSQLPEAVFQQVNENFYRTTFYELCSRFLSPWFVWHVERSYPQGKSDLEFVGKFHEKFAGLRWVIEFKYYSNSEFKKLKTTIEDFQLQAEDTRQIAGYAEGLREEYPQARISLFVIYCFGNQGFRVFSV